MALLQAGNVAWARLEFTAELAMNPHADLLSQIETALA
jgi:hypothetical protein